MNVVVNPEANKELASEINELLSDFIPKTESVRDNCKKINQELQYELLQYGYTPEFVYGLYRVDSIYGWLDPEDFEQSELVKVKDMFGDLSRDSLESYVEQLPEKEQEFYRYIPHWFLVVDDLILDAASDMFNCKNSPDRYFDSDCERIIS